MRFDAAELLVSVEALKLLAVDFAELQQNLESEIKLLQEEINLLKQRLFGRKSEKLSVGLGQLLLFNKTKDAETVNREPTTDFYLQPLESLFS